ncbi:hypothetical protein SteCoe_26867 [Stentor coeruleus]|uniref:Uncharacterized protein n=1 Tax=Stentor coeruleus TaxID=5963 RepID=A0A1R2BBS6_9CILI|nr:hypothetical protein SteCoe_26867 [Stentor coeruleus]
MIPSEDISKHSRLCVAITEEVKKLESMYSVDEWIFKIQKLKKCLENALKTQHLKPPDKNPIIIMIRIINQTVLDYTEESLINAINSLNGIINNFKGILNTRIYLDRLLSLVISLEKVVKNEKDIKDNVKDAIIMKTRLIKDLKIQTDYYKSKSDVLENAIFRTDRSKSPYGKRIDYVDSDLGSKRSDCSWVSPIQNDLSPLILDDDMSPNLKKVSQVCDKDLEKYFYSVCLALKIKYSSKEKRKIKLSNRKMFREAIDNKIPPEEWYNFINSQINDPDPKFILGPPRRRMYAETKQSFESIIEE